MGYLLNAWYCAAFGHELGESPLAVTIMDEPLVLYRTAGGQAACLQDRCPHRFAPLSRGKVCGDHLQCGYHGLEFGPDGACKRNPWGDHSIPDAARVRRYPVIERDLLLWVWMGDPERARPEEVLDLGAHLNVAELPAIHGAYTLSANYELVTDNLLDLSHGIYLHGGSLTNGPGQSGDLEVELKHQGRVVSALHRRYDEVPAPHFRKSWNRSERVDHHSDMIWHAPSNLVHDVGVTLPGRPAGEGISLHVAHLLTPVSAMQTRYHWIASRNFDIGNEAVGQALYEAITRAFTTEDEPMIAAVQQRMGTTDLLSLKPVALRGDAAGLRARRVLQKLREDEHAPTPAAERA